MNSRLRRTLADTAISACAVAAVLAVLVASDLRVREQAVRLMTGGPGGSIGSARTYVREASTVMYTAARHRSIDHAPLLVFVGAAGVLLLAMLRS